MFDIRIDLSAFFEFCTTAVTTYRTETTVLAAMFLLEMFSISTVMTGAIVYLILSRKRLGGELDELRKVMNERKEFMKLCRQAQLDQKQDEGVVVDQGKSNPAIDEGPLPQPAEDSEETFLDHYLAKLPDSGIFGYFKSSVRVLGGFPLFVGSLVMGYMVWKHLLTRAELDERVDKRKRSKKDKFYEMVKLFVTAPLTIIFMVASSQHLWATLKVFKMSENLFKVVKSWDEEAQEAAPFKQDEAWKMRIRHGGVMSLDGKVDYDTPEDELKARISELDTLTDELKDEQTNCRNMVHKRMDREQEMRDTLKKNGIKLTDADFQKRFKTDPEAKLLSRKMAHLDVLIRGMQIKAKGLEKRIKDLQAQIVSNGEDTGLNVLDRFINFLHSLDAMIGKPRAGKLLVFIGVCVGVTFCAVRYLLSDDEDDEEETSFSSQVVIEDADILEVRSKRGLKKKVMKQLGRKKRVYRVGSMYYDESGKRIDNLSLMEDDSFEVEEMDYEEWQDYNANPFQEKKKKKAKRVTFDTATLEREEVEKKQTHEEEALKKRIQKEEALKKRTQEKELEEAALKKRVQELEKKLKAKESAPKKPKKEKKPKAGKKEAARKFCEKCNFEIFSGKEHVCPVHICRVCGDKVAHYKFKGFTFQKSWKKHTETNCTPSAILPREPVQENVAKEIPKGEDRKAIQESYVQAKKDLGLPLSDEESDEDTASVDVNDQESLQKEIHRIVDKRRRDQGRREARGKRAEIRIDKVKQAIVTLCAHPRLENPDPKMAEGNGVACLINGQTFVMTANHVIDEMHMLADPIISVFEHVDGQIITTTATVAYQDENLDIALLSCPIQVKPIKVAIFEAGTRRQPVFKYCWDAKEKIWWSSPMYSQGHAYRGADGVHYWDVTTVPGNSGAGVFAIDDSTVNLIGVHIQGTSRRTNIFTPWSVELDAAVSKNC
jgi:hypothetical protein